jgi:hypothetical protein
MSIHGYVGNIITANPTAPTSTVASGVWTTEQQLAAKSAGNWPFTIPTQQISRSLRFNSADTAYLSRTLGTSNRRTFTFSAWLKRSLLASTQCVFGNINYAGGGSTNQQFFLGFTGSDQLDMFHYNNGTQNQVTSTAVYRDPSAWYHIVGAVDTTQATSSNRLKIYVNGSQITTLTTATYPPQNTDTFINANLATGIGRQEGTGISGSYFFSGYQTEIYFIDGQALTPSSFGQINASTGVWEPLAYAGTYGTNGFYLNFSDNSGTTSTTLGKDYSGNGNNWTPNNFSVTAGAGNDSLVDSPTAYGTDTGVGGEVRGNYATLNPIAASTNLTISDGNLRVVSASGADIWCGQGTMALTYPVYMEGQVIGSHSNDSGIGIYDITQSLGTFNGNGSNVIGSASTAYAMTFNNGSIKNSNSVSSYGTAFVNNDIWMMAFDPVNGKIWWGKNGTWFNSGNPAAGTNPAFSSITGTKIFGYSVLSTGVGFIYNAGQRAFAYTAPSGFKALCTQNLPTPTIGATSTTQANDYFDVTLYTGTGATQSITNSGSMQPDFLWIKQRGNATSHCLTDNVRGVNSQLISNSTDAQYTATDCITAINSNGFTVGANTQTAPDVNFTVGGTYVGWQWKANGAGSSNTAGTITSTVSASTTSGFSIVSFTSTGSQGTVGHGLGIAPSMIIMKQRSSGSAWSVYHVSIGNTKRLVLNATDAEATDSVWGNTTPTSTVFTQNVSVSTPTAIAYCFAPVAGYSAFGSFTGNGSNDGVFVYTGFRPEWVMLKSATQAYRWYMLDAARNTYNVMNGRLFANNSNAEATNSDILDFTSNGFKIRTSDAEINGSGQTIIYACFAEFPFKYALAR